MKTPLDYFQNRQAQILDSIRQIVDIESPSRDLSGSAAVADWLEKQAREISFDFEVERIFAAGYGEHFVLRAFSSLKDTPVLLLGHTDTVHPRGSFKDNPTRIEGDKFYGCGVFDMKANCVLILEVLRAFADLKIKPSRPVTVLLSCDEEIGSQTGRKLVEREAVDADFCLVCEPSAGGRVKTGRKGTGMFELKAHGIPAHAGLEPQRGASAILEIARQIEKLHAMNDFETGTTVTVGTMRGGTTSNVVPAEAECVVDVRFSSMAEAKRIESEIRSLESFDERVKLEITGATNRPPMERTANVVNLFEKARAVALDFNYDLGETQVGGASDGNFVAALNVPVLDGLGVSGDGAHTMEEFIFIDDIPKRAALIFGLLQAE